MKKTGKMIFIGLVLAFLYLPILVLAVYSFTKSTNIGAIRGFSMHNYVTLFSTPELVNMSRQEPLHWHWEHRHWQRYLEQ